MRVLDSSAVRLALALAGILALALVLRLWGINFGLPFVYHPDEGALTMPALNILQTGDYRPIRLDYGSAYIYSLTALYIPYFLFGAWRGYFTTVADLPFFADYHQIGAYPSPGVFLIARVLTAVLGVLTVLVVYSLGRRLGAQRVGLIAAFLLAIMPLHVSNSHFATVDVPMTFVLSLAMTRILDVYERGDWRDYLWAGILVGLTASTKFTGGVVLVALLAAHLLRARDWSDLANHRLAIGIVATIAGFLIGTPYALDLPYFLNSLARNFGQYGSAEAEPGVIIAGPSWLYYFKELFLGPFSPVAILGILGLAWFTWRNRRRGIILVCFPLLYFALSAVQTARYPRYLVPLIPFLVLGAGIALDEAVGWLANRRPTFKMHAEVNLAVAVLLVAACPILATIQQGVLLAGPDVRTQAFDWYKANIPPEAKVALEPASMPVIGWSRDVHLTWNLGEHSPEWYVDQNFDYLVVSEPRLLDPNLTMQMKSGYDQLMSRFPLIKTFQGAMLGTDGLRIWVYQVMP